MICKLCSSHRKEAVWICQAAFHRKHFLQLIVSATDVACSGYSSWAHTFLWAKVNPTVLVLVCTARELNGAKLGCAHMYLRGKAEIPVSFSSWLSLQLLPTYQSFLASKLLPRLFSSPDVSSYAFGIHELPRGQVTKQKIKYCMEKKNQIKMCHIVMVDHSASWAKCQSDWHISHAKLPQIGIRVMRKQWLEDQVCSWELPNASLLLQPWNTFISIQESAPNPSCVLQTTKDYKILLLSHLWTKFLFCFSLKKIIICMLIMVLGII